MTTPHPHAAELIDFESALRICRGVLSRTEPLPRGVERRLSEDFSEATVVAYDRVSALTGLKSPMGAPHSHLFDRFHWARANLWSLRELLSSVEYPKTVRSGAAGTLMRQLSGTELGLLFTVISGRVLGQYNMILAEEVPPGIYYVGPNVYGLERRHAFPPSEFRLWIALHEVCHHLQFTGVPWMEGYFLELVRKASSLGNTSSKNLNEALRRAVETVRRGENPLAENGVAGLVAGTELLGAMREAQALMSVLEGHAEYVMSVAAPELVPGQSRFASVLQARRAQAKPVMKFVQQALGFEAKLRQYREGHRFFEAVVERSGPEGAARVFERRENLPNLDELRHPSRWLARMGDVEPVDPSAST